FDLMSFSAHKFYGPKGVGGLYIRSFSPMVRLDAVTFGGGHERGFRPGTLNVPGIVGMAEAMSIAVQEQNAERLRVEEMSAVIIAGLQEFFPEIKINGHLERRLKHNLSITIPGVESKALIHALKDV